MCGEGFAVILAAPSGTGKTTLCRMLLERDETLTYSVSATTRPPRPGELEGKDYHFMDRETFQEKIRQDEFLEWAEYQGEYYGTPKPWLIEALARGKVVLLDMDIQGVKQIQESGLEDAVYIMIYPPSFDVLKERLSLRRTESQEILESRLSLAATEVQSYTLFDYLVMNKDLELASDILYSIVVAEKHRNSRQAPRFESTVLGSLP